VGVDPIPRPGRPHLLIATKPSAARDWNPQAFPPLKRLFKIVHTTQEIAMDESPVEAIRSKPDSSISVMCKMAAKGEATCHFRR